MSRIDRVGRGARRRRDGRARSAAKDIENRVLSLCPRNSVVPLAALEMSLAATRQYEIQTSFHLARTADHEEAKRAFAAKEEPVFSGR